VDFTQEHSAQEINEYLRFWLGGLPESTVSNETLNFIIDLVIQRETAATPCDIIYFSAIDLLKYLIRKGEQGSASTGGVTGSGEISKITEKVGSTSLTYEYDVGTSGGTSSKEAGWDRVLEDLQSDPNSIGCPVSTVEAVVKGVGQPHFGGVSQKEYDRVQKDSDSRNGFSYSSPFRQHLK